MLDLEFRREVRGRSGNYRPHASSLQQIDATFHCSGQVLYLAQDNPTMGDGRLSFSSNTVRDATVYDLSILLDGPAVPMYLRLGGQLYLAGKGFLAAVHNTPVRYEYLFAAVVNTERPVESINEVTLYVSREVYSNDRYKAVRAYISKLTLEHPADAVITRQNLEEVLEMQIEIPQARSLPQQKRLMDELLDDIFEGAKTSV